MLLSLPKGSSQDGITYKLNYNLPSSGIPTHTIAEIEYLADGVTVGRYFIQKEPTIEVILHETPTSTKVAVATSVSVLTIVGVMAFFILGSGTAVGLKNVHDDRKLSRHMQEKRAQRLREMEMSEEEFLALVERRRERKTTRSRSDDLSQLSLKQRARTHMEDEQLRERQASHTSRDARNRSRSRSRRR